MSLNISKFVISKAVTDPGIECQAQSEVTSPTAPVARTLTASQREKPLLPSSPACLSVCLSTWNNSVHSGRIFIKFRRPMKRRSIVQSIHLVSRAYATCSGINESHHQVQHYLNTSEKHFDLQIVE